MSGLVNRLTETPLPLRSSSIYTDIKGFTARTTAILTYYNDNRTEIEGLFVLPLDHGSAIVDFECVIEGHYIYAEVRDMKNGQDVIALHESEASFDGIFRISIGKIPPWILIEVQVTIVCEISVVFFGDALKYTLPQTFSPKLASKLEETSIQRFTAISTLGYTFQLEIFIEAPCLLCGVQSNTHPIQVDAPPLSKTGSKIKVTLPDDFEPTNEIFELLMFLCRPREPYIIIEQPCTSVAKEYGKTKNPINNIMHNSILMLSYSPDISNFQKELDDNLTNQAAEFYLIFHTLAENNIQDACRLFLKSLPSNCYFNMLCTGTKMEPLFKTSQSYSAKTMDQASSYINNAASRKPVTSPLNLIEAIRWVYCEKTSANIPRQAFIIGQHGENLYNNEIIELARRRHHLVRFFCVYLHNEDTSIYRSLSAITNGNCYNVDDDVLVSKQLIACLKAAMKPAVTNLTISWILPDAYDVIYTPENLPVLHLGNRLNLYAILDMKDHESNLSRQKPSADSINSIKEFWFEDYDFYDDQTEGPNNCSSHDLLTEVATDEVNTPETKSKEELLETAPVEEERKLRDSENEVFLTDEEAFQLKDTMGWQKRLSVDRVQKWRVSRNPENSDLDTAISDTECEIYMQYQTQKNERRKKSSSDGFESIGSSNSYGSNLSSSSHFLGFPGYPTRLGSCRSVEARSPHMPKFNDDTFTFPADYTHERPINTDRYSMPDELPKEVCRKKIISKAKGRKKLTQALIDEQVNTHLLDRSNEAVIYRLIEGIVIEKREKLSEWVSVQEEMTQCNWPILQKDMKRSFDKTMWRDSGIGHRSSSEPRTSDMEDETNGLKKCSSSFVLHDRKSREDTFETKSLNIEMKSLGTNQTIPQSMSSEPDILEVKKRVTSQVTSPPKAKKISHQEFVPPTPKSSTTEKNVFKKKLKAKNIWNNLVDKVKNLTSSVPGGKSGETSFTVSENKHAAKAKENMTFLTKHQNIRDNTTVKNEFTQLHQIMKNTEEYEDNNEKLTKTIIPEPEPVKPEITRPRPSSERIRHRLVKTRPLIENSRTISTSSMIEIGQTEIGDIDSLHLLPSQALIYLSGNFGNRKFKRIIPFQMEVASGSEESCDEYTIHQLAAKSIIRDLEIQMDEDTLLENTGRNYIKSLASEVSRSAHILSKHTSVVMVDDDCKGSEVISIVNPPFNRSSDVRLSRPTYLNINNVTERSEPLYEIQREMSPLQGANESKSKVFHTKLILKSPQFHDNPLQVSPLTEQKSCGTKLGYLRLIDLMNVDGYWETSHAFAEILTVNYSQLRESCPFADITVKNQKASSVTRRTASSKSEKMYDLIWTTTLALVWVYSYWEDFKEEWVLIDEKAKKWLKRKKLPTGFTLPDIFIIAQQTLKILKSNSRKASIRNT